MGKHKSVGVDFTVTVDDCGRIFRSSIYRESKSGELLETEFAEAIIGAAIEFGLTDSRALATALEKIQGGDFNPIAANSVMG